MPGPRWWKRNAEHIEQKIATEVYYRESCLAYKEKMLCHSTYCELFSSLVANLSYRRVLSPLVTMIGYHNEKKKCQKERETLTEIAMSVSNCRRQKASKNKKKEGHLNRYDDQSVRRKYLVSVSCATSSSQRFKRFQNLFGHSNRVRLHHGSGLQIAAESDSAA
jgi:hypothetical protein